MPGLPKRCFKNPSFVQDTGDKRNLAQMKGQTPKKTDKISVHLCSNLVNLNFKTLPKTQGKLPILGL
jgi:hypothetical protein